MPDFEVSVVIPTRNRRALLRRLLVCLDGIDDGLRYEVIVIDEGSTDDTQQFLDAFVPARFVLRVVRHDPPLGISGARNAGLVLASAPYVAWIDDDDLTSPDRLRRQRELLMAGLARWSCAGKVDIDDDLSVVGHTRCPAVDGFLEALLAFNVLPAAGQGLLVETALAREIGGFDRSLAQAEDWDFALRLAELGLPAILDEPLVGYRTGVASMSTATAQMASSIEAVIAKHRSTSQRLGVRPAWHDIHHSLLAADLLTSRRRAAWRALRALAARPSLKGTVRCLVTIAAPRFAARRSSRRRREQVPQAWRDAAEQWLGPQRAGG